MILFFEESEQEEKEQHPEDEVGTLCLKVAEEKANKPVTKETVGALRSWPTSTEVVNTLKQIVHEDDFDEWIKEESEKTWTKFTSDIADEDHGRVEEEIKIWQVKEEI